MKQLLILSGKGGTGKTTVASAFIHLARAKAYGDCDVDAPNLHLIMCQSTIGKSTDYMGMAKAKIDPELCTGCDLCRQNCRFDAIKVKETHQVISYACEGCAVCQAICPVHAISMHPEVAGELLLYHQEAVFSTATLKMGSGTSGKLVTEVKKQLTKEAKNVDFAIIDGSPGIGCPVIASLNGVEMVLMVAEPSISGISDMERIFKTAKRFHAKIAVCINKYDTNQDNTAKIEQYCQEQKIAMVGKIPYDPLAVTAINQGISIVEIDCPSGEATKEVFAETMKRLGIVGEYNV